MCWQKSVSSPVVIFCPATHAVASRVNSVSDGPSVAIARVWVSWGMFSFLGFRRPYPGSVHLMIHFRPVEISDALWIEDALSHEQVAFNTSTIPHPLTDQFVETWVLDLQKLETQDRGFRIVGTATDAQGFGSAAIKRTDATTGELSFWIAPRFWRQGLASQISKAAVDRARDAGFLTLTAGHFHDNFGSLSVLRKLNFNRLDPPVEVFSLSRNKIVQTVRYELRLSR